MKGVQKVTNFLTTCSFDHFWQSFIDEVDGFRSKPEAVCTLSQQLLVVDEGNVSAVTDANNLQRRYDNLTVQLKVCCDSFCTVFEM